MNQLWRLLVSNGLIHSLIHFFVEVDVYLHLRLAVQYDKERVTCSGVKVSKLSVKPPRCCS